MGAAGFLVYGSCAVVRTIHIVLPYVLPQKHKVHHQAYTLYQLSHRFMCFRPALTAPVAGHVRNNAMDSVYHVADN